MQYGTLILARDVRKCLCLCRERRLAVPFLGQLFLQFDAQPPPVASRSCGMRSRHTQVNHLGRQTKQVEGSWQVSNRRVITRGCLPSMRRLDLADNSKSCGNKGEAKQQVEVTTGIFSFKPHVGGLEAIAAHLLKPETTEEFGFS
ncbi:hypothetical protein RRG08_025788 [Elysia crispata]|uniref:Uncharacterized protein n=1 Tax=Elysia crispata TaxID=231223 RepID=A0AAE0Y4E5_9GAST|nr:hypothetical protein RRG08_025788 [Elysia crispata]